MLATIFAMSDIVIHIASEQAKAKAINLIASLEENGRYVVEIRKTKKTRTGQQNRALHLWLRMMADAMNNAGINTRGLFSALREGFELPIGLEDVKKIVNQVSKDRFGRTTSKLTTTEIQELYEICNAAFGQSVGISLPWPHMEEP